MKQSTLSARLLALGAVPTVVGEWEVPGRVTSFEQDYAAIRFQAGVIDLSHRAAFRVTGAQRNKFLQGILTNDVQSLVPGRGVYAAVLTSKGKMQSDLTAYALDEWIWIDAEAEGKAKLGPTLDRYTIGTDAQVHDVGDHYGLIGVYGPAAPHTLTKAFPGLTEPNSPLGVATRPDRPHLIVAEAGYPATPGYKLLVPRGDLDAVWDTLTQAGAAPAGWDALEAVRIEAGWPRFGCDMTEENFPPEARIEDRAVSYTKGCYMGQETIARIRTYGHVNRLLVGLLPEVDTPLPRGVKLYHPDVTSILREKKEAGYVTSSIYSPALRRIIAMGYVHRSLDIPGTVVTLGNDVSSRATVVALPFAPPASPLP